ncbi:glycoside hydrolase family 43 protein [Jackrogersella minutella]|nr:glycoside hydrolase family 43 protein [Jackrogersella minutella]
MFFTTRKLITAFLGATSCLLSPVAAFTNSIRNPGGSDPQIVYSDGYYYLMSTTWSNVQIARATSIEGLKTAERKTIYSSSEASRCCNVWAPEVHLLGGAWYVYFSAGNGDNLDGQNLHVLKGGASPWDDYTYATQLTNEWSIDGTIVQFSEWGNYVAWSCLHDVQYQSICLQKLGDDNTSLQGAIGLISQPTNAWEQSGTPVNEGPAALYIGGKTYIGYSANYCWTPDYCIATLEWDGTTDPLDVAAWTKSDGCLMKGGVNGHYGTGHNAFFKSPDGSQTWNVYHATSNSAGACNDSRYTMVQIVTTNTDGTVNLGTPVPFSFDSAEPL